MTDYYHQNIDQKSSFLSKIGISEFFELLFYLFVAFILVYFVDFRLNRWVFLIILPIVWFSKRDYLWIAFFFILMEMPGGLFSGGLKDDLYRLPIYSLAPGFSFSIHELFILVILAKTLFLRRITNNYSPPFFQKDLKSLSWLFTGLILISPVLGMSLNSISNVFKLALSLTLFYSLIRLISTEDQLIRFLKIMLPFAFLALSLQFYGLINGEQLIALFKPGIKATQGTYSVDNPEGWIRPIEMGHAMVITFTGSFFLLIRESVNRNIYYLILINILSFLVILMSGTRIWVIAFALAYLAFFILSGSRIPKLIVNSIVILFIVIMMVKGVSVIDKQVNSALNRIATVGRVLEGDITGGGTISRYDIRAPKVMEGFYSSTIILGAGFSDLYYNYADGHVGYHNILLNTGIVGFLLFIYVIIKTLRRPFLIKKYNYIFKGQLLKVSIISLLILLIINIGTQTVGFTPDSVNRVILMVYSLVMIDIAIKSTVNEPVSQEKLFLGQHG